ncbi:unnamed protein product, partial [marine sediment metagenome]
MVTEFEKRFHAKVWDGNIRLLRLVTNHLREEAGRLLQNDEPVGALWFTKAADYLDEFISRLRSRMDEALLD